MRLHGIDAEMQLLGDVAIVRWRFEGLCRERAAKPDQHASLGVGEVNRRCSGGTRLRRLRLELGGRAVDERGPPEAQAVAVPQPPPATHALAVHERTVA